MAKEKLTEQQYEEFDYITDFYMPIKEVEDKYNSPHLKRLRDAKIDAYEYLGLEKVEGVGEIQKIQDKSELAEAKKTAGQHLIDFAKDFIPATITETQEAGANVLNNVVQLFGFGSNMMFKGTKFDEVSQTTTEFAQGYNKGTEEFIARLNKYKEENDVNGASELVGELGIDIGAYFPINKMLKKAGVPDKVAMPIAFGLAWGFTGGDEETEKNMFIDSEVIHGVNEILGILPDTPESEVAELVGNTFEGTIWAYAGDRLVKAFKIIKNNVPAFINQQTATAVGGSAIAGSAAMELQEQTPDLNVENPDLNQEKKTLNFDEQEQISSPMPGDDEMASAGSVLGPIFKSIVRETAKKLPNKGTGEQIFNTLKNSPGVKSSELKWTGLDEFLKGKKSVTKQEVQDFLKNNSVDVTEVMKGGKVAKLSDDLEQKILNFEQKIEKAARAKDLGYADINYDVYPYLRHIANNKEVSMSTKDMSMDFAQLNDMLSNLPINQKNWFKDYLGKSGKVEIHKLTDNINNRPVYVGKDLADTLIKEKELIRDIPAALNTPGYERYTRNRVLEFDALDIEKFLIEREKRIFMSKHSAPKFEGQTEPGGKDYTELVFKVKKGGMDIGIPTMKNDGPLKYTPYKNPAHMDSKSEIAHVRFKTRNLNDMKVLTVEEMQSDFATAVRKSKQVELDNLESADGFKIGEMARELGMENFTLLEAQDAIKKSILNRSTDFPFKNTWYEMTTKRLIRYAADNGFDAVAIPKGSVIQDRYRLTSRIDDFQIGSFDPVRKEVGLEAYDQKGTLQVSDLYTFDRVEKEFGKDVLDRVVKKGKTLTQEDYDDVNTYVNLGKTIEYGGEGKNQLYNIAIPKFMKKYGKKWNAKVYDDEFVSKIDEKGNLVGPEDLFYEHKIPVTIIKLTPEMKKAVQTDGQALFSIFGLGGVGASVVSDSIKNNNISQTTN